MSLLPILSLNQFPQNGEKLFYANEFTAHIEAHHKNIDKPHKHDFYLTVLFTKGTGLHEIDFDSYEIRKGSVFMLSPGQTHHWDFSKETNGYILFHTKAFYDLAFGNRTIENFPFFYSLQNTPHLLIEGQKLPPIELLFQHILQEYRADSILKDQKISSLLDVLYIELTREYSLNGQAAIKSASPYQEKLRLLEHLINQHYVTHKAASDYAEMMHMTSRHLNRIVRTGLGKTTTDLISERILLEAQRMLSHSKVTVSEVADALGYKDHSYFARIFKQKLDVSPSDFARKYHP